MKTQRISNSVLLWLSLLILPATGADYRFVKGAEDAPIAVAEWGNKNAPDVLLLHGAGFAKEYWMAQRTEAADECAHYVAMDLRGHGASAKPWREDQIVDSELWAADVQAVITNLDMHNVLIVGWSYGGYVAMDYLRHHTSENIAGVLLLGSAAGLVERPQFSGDMPAGFAASATQRRSLNLDENRLGSSYIGALMSSYDLPEPIASSWTNQMASSPLYFRNIMSQRALDNTDLIESLALPLTFLLGERDLSVSAESIEQLATTRLTSASVRIAAGAGHAVSHDSGREFYETLGDMLKAGHSSNPNAGRCIDSL